MKTVEARAQAPGGDVKELHLYSLGDWKASAEPNSSLSGTYRRVTVTIQAVADGWEITVVSCTKQGPDNIYQKNVFSP